MISGTIGRMWLHDRVAAMEPFDIHQFDFYSGSSENELLESDGGKKKRMQIPTVYLIWSIAWITHQLLLSRGQARIKANCSGIKIKS